MIPLADHGALVTALPFVVPALAVIVGLAVLVVRDRLGSSSAGDSSRTADRNDG